MPRSEARLLTSIWEDDDFLVLPPGAQRLYMFLIAQKDLTYCGVIPFRTARWARKAKGLTPAQIEADLELLAAGPRPFIILDEDTGELFVRSLIRHDGVWKVPNIMKAARESAALIESQMIRAVLLNELLRIPAQQSESKQVRAVHAEFVNDLRKGSANPSPNPSRNGNGKHQADPSANGSADPSQGKGEGYGPVLQVSPNPLTPSPSPRATAAAGAVRPLWPSAAPDARPEEGNQSGEQTAEQLASAVRRIRPAWSTKSIERALADPSVAERPWPMVCAAMLAVANDPESKHPGRLAHDGPWWAKAALSRCASLPPVERHTYEPAADNAGCASCGLPATNRRHLEAS